jgi:uncharacterized membrane protein YeaQ/YmgE (transglycosylase-associated protein family)
MNIVMWLVAGGLLGWISHSVLGLNEARGRILCIIIGAFGGAIGGKEVAPMFTSAVAGEFSVSAMMFALAVAAAFLAISQLMSSQFDL